MDRLTALQEAIDRTVEAAGHYGPERQVLSIETVDLFAAPDPQGHGNTSLTAGIVQRALVTIADDHRGCTMSGCGTCDALRTGLAACLSELRDEQQKALRAQFDRTEGRSLWRRRKRDTY